MCDGNAEELKTMDLTEFRELGLVQEINRLLLHPMGLALSVLVEEDGTVSGFGEVWDYRDDPEGLFFQEDMIDPDKVDRVREMFLSKLDVRKEQGAFPVQMVPEENSGN